MIDRLTIAMPIRRRTETLNNCLRMLFAHSCFQHDIKLVFDRAKNEVVDWVNQNMEWLNKHNVEVLTSPYTEFPERGNHDQYGTANASNWAWKHAETEWLMCMDDDMYCSKNWDYNILRRIRDVNMVYVPINVRPEISVQRTAGWGEWYHLTYPKQLTREKAVSSTEKTYYALESEWLQWCDQMKVNDVYGEPCSERRVGHWMPLIIHKNVFLKSGGFEPGVGRDINFDSKLGRMGYMKTVVRDSFFLHMKGEMVLDVTKNEH